MGLKRYELENALLGRGCLGKADDEEPVFILRAQDATAANTVRFWATQAEARGCAVEKVREARDCADQMEAWPHRKNPD